MNQYRKINMVIALVVGPACIVLMSGCVAGQKINLQHPPGSGPAMSSAKTVSVDAQDKRDFVVNGNKKPSYLGHFRAGFGNTWDVNNAKNRALADQFKKDVEAELQAHGVKTVASGERKIGIDIINWNFDAFQNGRFKYELFVSVTDAQGIILANTTLKDEKVIRGNIWTGAPSAFKRELPKIYSGIIKDILSKPEIQKTLK